MNQKYLKRFYLSNKHTLQKYGDVSLDDMTRIIANYIEHGFRDKYGIEINGEKLLEDTNSGPGDFPYGMLSDYLQDRLDCAEPGVICLTNVLYLPDYNNLGHSYILCFAKKDKKTLNEISCSRKILPINDNLSIDNLLVETNDLDCEEMERLTTTLESKYINKKVKDDLKGTK